MSENFLGKVAVKIFILNESNNLLVVRQSELEDYEVPGGRIDLGESIEDAMKRELFEELNIEIKNFNYKIENNFQAMNPNEKIQHLYFIVSLKLNKEDVEKISTSNEVTEMVWIDSGNYQNYKYKKFLEEDIEKFINKVK